MYSEKFCNKRKATGLGGVGGGFQEPGAGPTAAWGRAAAEARTCPLESISYSVQSPNIPNFREINNMNFLEFSEALSLKGRSMENKKNSGIFRGTFLTETVTYSFSDSGIFRNLVLINSSGGTT